MYKLLLGTLLLSTPALSADTAPSPKIDTDRITVSGISAGGQMAHQLHISYSDLFSGAGIIASGAIWLRRRVTRYRHGPLYG